MVALSALADGVAGIQWTPPSNWKNEGSRPMRAATYTVPAAAGDSEGAECVAYFFGKGQGGSAEANVARWQGQFQAAGGGPVKATNLKKTYMSGFPVTTLEVAGTYTGSGGPMAETKSSKPFYKLLGAIIEGPGGNVFFKLTGPTKTVAANQAAFNKMIASLKFQ